VVVAVILPATTLRRGVPREPSSTSAADELSISSSPDLAIQNQADQVLMEPAEHTHPKDVVVDFEGEEPIRVEFRKFRFEVFDFPFRLADAYEDLSVKALNGNGAAAHALYLIGEQCRNIAVDQEEMEDIVNKLYAERMLYLPDRPSGIMLEDQDIAQHESQIRTQFRRCQGLSREQRMAGVDSWLPLAVKHGYLPAVDRLSWISYEQGDVAKSLEYLEQAWVLGSPLALGGLYEVYLNGGEGIEPDPELATAHLYLVDALFDARHIDAELGPVLRRKNLATKTELAERMASLRPSSAERAVELARQILLSNPHCCVDW
jgi:tetratricopeptide (TPR) repeat protein